MELEKYLQQIKTSIELITNRQCRITSTGELECVCPKCGGSKTKKNKRQFYISLTDKEHPFICFRCGFKGRLINLVNFLLSEYKIKIDLSETSKVNNNFIEDSSIYENTFDLTQYYTLNFYRRQQFKKFLKTNNIEKVYDEVSLNYIFDRIYAGVRDEMNKILEKHQLLNQFEKNIVSTFLSKFFVEKFTQNKYSNHVGICSFKGHNVQFRNLDKNSKIRYISMKLTPFQESSDYPAFILGKSFSDSNIIILAEGIFTLLRGFLHLLSLNYLEKIFGNKSYILISTNGKVNLIRELNNLKKTERNVLVLLDQDVNINAKFFQNIKFLKPIETLKDFGEIDLTNNCRQFLEVEIDEFKRTSIRIDGGIL